jgi:hypothetical protein
MVQLANSFTGEMLLQCFQAAIALEQCYNGFWVVKWADCYECDYLGCGLLG